MTQLAVPGRWVVRSRLRMRDPLFVAVLAVCSALALIAAIGPYIAPYPPAQTDILASGEGPSAAHWLGTDSLGRDVLSRLLVGARLSFAGPGLVVLVSTTLGTALALAGAWFGGWFDSLLNKVLNVLFAIPGILVAVLAVAVFGVGFWAPVLALSLVYVPYIARVVRSAAIQERHKAYVEACELAGLSARRITSRHILGNVFPIVLAQATFGFGAALMDFGAISFLGLGVQPPAAEWGLMVSDGRSELLEGSFQQSVSAGLMIVITVVAFNMLGERISTRLGAAR
ncbi:ABC transporter permease [Okibacterium endophyticum]